MPGGLQYRGEYLVPVGSALRGQFGESLAGRVCRRDAGGIGWIVVPRFAVAQMMTVIREDLAALGVRHDVFSSERALVEAGCHRRDHRAAWREQGLIYEGVLEPPKGKTPEDWEPREQTLFRATDFGDDVDRPLRKSDGSNTYFANDIAYHADKMARGARRR